MIRLLAIVAALLILTGCEPKSGAGSASGKIRVTCTVGMVADTVRNVGGDRVAVTALMGPGVDPHLYKASEGDISRLSDADIIFYNGLNLEGKMGEILSRMDSAGKPVIAVGESIDKSLLRHPAQFQGHPDPHVWFDVRMWAQTVQPVVDGLSKVDPANAAAYAANGEAYRKVLIDLHAYCKQQLAAVPRAQRVMITAHDAFGYFGRAYDVEVVGLQGISTASEYGLEDVRRLVDLIVGRRIKAIFVESSVPRRSIEAVAEGCKARGHAVAIGGTLFSDAMGEPGTPEGTYPGMVRHNVDTLVKALK